MLEIKGDDQRLEFGDADHESPFPRPLKLFVLIVLTAANVYFFFLRNKELGDDWPWFAIYAAIFGGATLKAMSMESIRTCYNLSGRTVSISRRGIFGRKFYVYDLDDFGDIRPRGVVAPFVTRHRIVARQRDGREVVLCSPQAETEELEAITKWIESGHAAVCEPEP